MKFTIIDMDVFETMLMEINNLADVVAKLHQDHGDIVHYFSVSLSG